MVENRPVLKCIQILKPDYEGFQNIVITSDKFTIGRGINNSLVIPILSISRSHCTFKNMNDKWFIEDSSSYGIMVNGNKLKKNVLTMLTHEDVIVLDPSEKLIYKFLEPSDDFEIPRKRIKTEKTDHDIFNDVKTKFEQSQSYEIKQIEEKIQNAKHMQETKKIMKEKLQSDMNNKILQLESNFALQIESIKGEKDEVEKQKALLISERDTQLASVKKDMQEQIMTLMDQISKHNKTESELFNENNELKNKLLKEREEFLSELNRESSSKQLMLEKLEAKIREQEGIRLREKQELEQKLIKETELLKLAKEEELQALENQKKQRELELEQELTSIKKDLEEQVQQAEQERLKAEKMLNEQMEQRKKVADEENIKMEELMQEREAIKKKLAEAQKSAEKSIEELQSRVVQRETELAALAADRIQKQADLSNEVISSLQEQLENVKNQLKSVETEKNCLLECVNVESSSRSTKESALAEVGELLESELQCSICAELFMTAITLGCSHTFCKYCITKWKKKKKDCPICRTSITSECKSLVLDSFIDKMVANLTEDLKQKRRELLKSREELESELTRQLSEGTSRRSFSYDESDFNSDFEFIEEGEGEEEEEELEDDEYDLFDSYWPFRRRRYGVYPDSGSDSDTD